MQSGVFNRVPAEIWRQIIDEVLYDGSLFDPILRNSSLTLLGKQSTSWRHGEESSQVFARAGSNMLRSHIANVSLSIMVSSWERSTHILLPASSMLIYDLWKLPLSREHHDTLPNRISAGVRRKDGYERDSVFEDGLGRDRTEWLWLVSS